MVPSRGFNWFYFLAGLFGFAIACIPDTHGIIVISKLPEPNCLNQTELRIIFSNLSEVNVYRKFYACLNLYTAPVQFYKFIVPQVLLCFLGFESFQISFPFTL